MSTPGSVQPLLGVGRKKAKVIGFLMTKQNPERFLAYEETYPRDNVAQQ